METRGERHRVDTLVTWDTPHRGTMTQLGVQWFVENFAAAHPALESERELVGFAAPTGRWTCSCWAPTVASTVDPRRKRCWRRCPGRSSREGFSSPAAAAMEPARCGPGQVLAHWVRPGPTARSACGRSAAPKPVASGSLAGQAPPPLQLPGEVNWDGMPGGREPYVGQVAAILVDLAGGRVTPAQPPSTCVVPTVSALDLAALPTRRFRRARG